MKKIKIIGVGILTIIFFSNIASASDIFIKFNSTKYNFRWSQNTQFEFTPSGQEDLSTWSDMITINYYTSVSDGDGLGLAANQVLGNYTRHGGKLILTDSVPRTKNKSAEHLIVFVMGEPGFLEFVQARFKIVDGVGASIIHSHKIYGEKVGPEMSKWMEENGASLGSKLMALKKIPTLSKLNKKTK